MAVEVTLKFNLQTVVFKGCDAEETSKIIAQFLSETLVSVYQDICYQSPEDHIVNRCVIFTEFISGKSRRFICPSVYPHT